MNRNVRFAAVLQLQIDQSSSRWSIPSILCSICQLVNSWANRTMGSIIDCCLSLPRLFLGIPDLDEAWSVIYSLFVAPTAFEMARMGSRMVIPAPTAFGMARMGSRVVVLRGMIWILSFIKASDLSSFEWVEGSSSTSSMISSSSGGLLLMSSIMIFLALLALAARAVGLVTPLIR